MIERLDLVALGIAAAALVASFQVERAWRRLDPEVDAQLAWWDSDADFDQRVDPWGHAYRACSAHKTRATNLPCWASSGPDGVDQGVTPQGLIQGDDVHIDVPALMDEVVHGTSRFWAARVSEQALRLWAGAFLLTHALARAVRRASFPGRWWLMGGLGLTVFMAPIALEMSSRPIRLPGLPPSFDPAAAAGAPLAVWVFVVGLRAPPSKDEAAP